MVNGELFTALKASIWQAKQISSKYEQLVLKLIAMYQWFLSSLVAYLSLQLSSAFNTDS